MLSSATTTSRPFVAAGRPQARRAVVVKAAWQKATTKTALKESGGKQVVELNGSRVLIVGVGEEVFAVSNKCSHLGLPIVGKTAVFQGTVTPDKCVVCPAHGTAFDLASGEVKGEWCPKFPTLPLVGKLNGPKPLPTYQSRVDEAGNIEVMI